MAPDLKPKKRKAAGTSTASKAKKARKSDADASLSTTHTKAGRKRKSLPTSTAIESSGDEGVVNPEPKKVKKTTIKSTPTDATVDVVRAAKIELLDEDEPPKTISRTRKREEVTKPAAEEDEGDSDDVVADQTAALLKGFESSGGSEIGSEDEEGGIALSKIPAPPKDKKLGKQLSAAEDDDERIPGVVYVGRVPHGFYEHQMHAYFSQFGPIQRLRLSRNRKTGRSKHYAFIEFASAAVARIVARAMDKYLLFGHILQVRFVPPEQVHPQLFKGAGRRFKVIPRNHILGRQLDRGTGREGWRKRIKNEEERRKEKAEKLRALGYEFVPPQIRPVEDVPMQESKDETVQAVQDGGGGDAAEAEAVDEGPKAIEAPDEAVTVESLTRLSEAGPDGVKVTEKVKWKKGKLAT